jgi:hypothetical protein
MILRKDLLDLGDAFNNESNDDLTITQSSNEVTSAVPQQIEMQVLL